MIKSKMFTYDEIYIDGIQTYVIKPKKIEDKIKTLIFYHGWGSNIERQVFRGTIFASYGYQVIIPEERNHGSRGNLDYEDANTIKEYFFRTLMGNVEESTKIYNYAIENLEADENNIIIGGHSLGAISAGAIFTFNKKIKSLISFNGSMEFEELVKGISQIQGTETYEMMRRNEFIRTLNPIRYPENLVDRKICLLNGQDDDTVSNSMNEKFYQSIKEKYKNKKDLCFEKFEKTGHQLTTQMLERALEFLEN